MNFSTVATGDHFLSVMSEIRREFYPESGIRPKELTQNTFF